MGSLYSMLHSRFGVTLSAPERHARIEELRLERLKRLRQQQLSLQSECIKRLKEKSVAIVGGGFAGLLAARNLCRMGVSVTVFEAYSEVGGRVRSNPSFSQDRIIEEGAELIGSMHTTWQALAIEYGLAWISRMDADLYAREGLKLRVLFDKDRSLTEDRLKQIYKLMDKFLALISRDAKLIEDPSQPWLQTKYKKQLETFDNMSVDDWLKQRFITKDAKSETIRLLWQAFDMLLRNNNVAPLHKLNYLSLLCLVKGGQLGHEDIHLMGYWRELETFRCADGCQQLAFEMKKEIEKKPKCKINLNTMVRVIDISKQEVKLKWIPVIDGKPAHGPEQESEGYDFVILAIPPSVWGTVNINPKHPMDQGQIGEMGRGPAVKFFSIMKERFWIKEGTAPSGGSFEMGQVWEGTDNQTRIRASQMRGRRQDQGIVLSVFAGGRIPTIKNFEDGLKKLYRTYDPRNNVLDTLYVDWTDSDKKPFIQTGYSSPKKGQIFRIGGKLREAFEERLFFAGEHTQMDSFGYMEGALRSGEHAARQVMLQACRLPPRPKVFVT